MSPLITAAELHDLLASARPPKALDVRWRLDRPDGRTAFAAGHVPGAVYVDLDSELAAHGAPADGRHPLPSPAQLQAAARRWGLNDGDTVVVYDDIANMSSARAWWLLRDAGVEVRVLDGAYEAWVHADYPIETGPIHPTAGNVTLDPGRLATVGMDAAADVAARGVLLDARAGERYRGEVEPIDPKAGHIPGAVSAPTTENVDDEGRFLPADVLRTRFESLGVTGGIPVGAYCGSGVTASHEVLALAIAGFDAALYPGSWSQWSNTPGRPVATGS
ncbi:sulfurtransferase [Microbacterium protaetiae]|uniref:Sulfurtransferase n=1 Tax=Microbacterium protaetiae TaxID=2509458 RepID=A0A4V0YDB1_9MICO|nr:sulfurtransferase [Microbacterium protaetiae]QAY60091.1 sulfurtransferase [Microbacterium protaetiae]